MPAGASRHMARPEPSVSLSRACGSSAASSSFTSAAAAVASATLELHRARKAICCTLGVSFNDYMCCYLLGRDSGDQSAILSPSSPAARRAIYSLSEVLRAAYSLPPRPARTSAGARPFVSGTSA